MTNSCPCHVLKNRTYMSTGLGARHRSGNARGNILSRPSVGNGCPCEMRQNLHNVIGNGISTFVVFPFRNFDPQHKLRKLNFKEANGFRAIMTEQVLLIYIFQEHPDLQHEIIGFHHSGKQVLVGKTAFDFTGCEGMDIGSLQKSMTPPSEQVFVGCCMFLRNSSPNALTQMLCLCMIHHKGFGLFHHWSFWATRKFHGKLPHELQWAGERGLGSQCFVLDIIQVCCFTPVCSVNIHLVQPSKQLQFMFTTVDIHIASLLDQCRKTRPLINHHLRDHIPCQSLCGCLMECCILHAQALHAQAPIQGHFTTTMLHRIQQDPQAEIGMTGWEAESFQLLTSTFTKWAPSTGHEPLIPQSLIIRTDFCGHCVDSVGNETNGDDIIQQTMTISSWDSHTIAVGWMYSDALGR